MRRILAGMVLVMAGVGAAGTARASVVDFNGTLVDVVSTTGAGANQAMMVIDFGGGFSYAFRYEWDGAATGWDMLNAIVSGSGGALTMASTYYPLYLAHTVDGLSYAGHNLTTTGGFLDPYSNFPGYWNSTDGLTWTPASFGVDGRTLSNFAWDGWSQENTGEFGFDYNLHNPPATPLASLAPEPASAALMLLGSVTLLRRRRAT